MLVRALVAAAVVAVVVGGIFGGPPAVRAVQDHFATRVPVHPVAWVASHAAPKQGAVLAGDGYSNTWWGTGYAGDSAGQYLEARFAEPTDLLSVLITPGSAKNTTQADGQATPQTFDLVVKDAGASSTSRTTASTTAAPSASTCASGTPCRSSWCCGRPGGRTRAGRWPWRSWSSSAGPSDPGPYGRVPPAQVAPAAPGACGVRGS
ncbi:hypothetical protein O1L60_01710 [Streptomyces diastatochromogenes]|nr:hypothetical protein [Streptomyces diastatochromogenes]